MSRRPGAIARAALQAYVDKDRAAIEAIVADDFRFTSPLDNGLDRETYLRRCWPNSEATQAVTVVHEVEDESRAFLVYEMNTTTKRFRNSEVHTVRDGQLVAVEVYFGWDLPHRAPAGQFVSSEGGAFT